MYLLSNENKQLGNLGPLEKLETPKYSVFVGYEFVQCAGAE